MNNIVIRNKLILAFAVVLLGTIVLAAFSLTRVHRLSVVTSEILDHVTATSELSDMRHDAADLRALAGADVLGDDQAQQAGFVTSEFADRRQFQAQWARYGQSMDFGRETEDGTHFKAAFDTAVSEMDLVTQQNAAMVEQATAASHSLTREAEALAGLVQRFDTGEDRAPSQSDGLRVADFV